MNKISAHGPQPGYLAPDASWHCSNVPPVLAHLLPLRLVTPRATPDCSKRATCAPGAAVNRGWREADDRKKARVSTDVSEDGSQAVMKSFRLTGLLAHMDKALAAT